MSSHPEQATVHDMEILQSFLLQMNSQDSDVPPTGSNTLRLLALTADSGDTEISAPDLERLRPFRLTADRRTFYPNKPKKIRLLSSISPQPEDILTSQLAAQITLITPLSPATQTAAPPAPPPSSQQSMGDISQSSIKTHNKSAAGRNTSHGRNSHSHHQGHHGIKSVFGVHNIKTIAASGAAAAGLGFLVGFISQFLRKAIPRLAPKQYVRHAELIVTAIEAVLSVVG